MYLIVYQALSINNTYVYHNALILATNKSEAYKKFTENHASPVIINIIEL